MSAAALPTCPTATEACPRCGGLNAAGRRACGHCFAPMSGDLFRAAGAIRRPQPGRWLAGLLAAGCLSSFVPNSPLAALKDRLLSRAEAPSRLVSVPLAPQPGLGKYEPARGCFLGAFVLNDINISGRMTRWEELTGKGHASYLCYIGYGRPFPREWVAEVRRLGAVPNIALEPNDGLQFVKDEVLGKGQGQGAGGPNPATCGSSRVRRRPPAGRSSSASRAR
jgi:hypothetical protein